ncbi:MAG: hypothetical protein GY765_24385 [bacterium]|nr:hypothetical protein [bacterium]
MKNTGKTPNFSRLFSLVILLVVVGILSLGYTAFKKTEKTVYAHFNRQQQTMAVSSREGISSMIEHLAREMRGLRKYMNLEAAHAPGQILQHVYNELKPLGVNDIGYLDKNGIVRLNVVAPALLGKNFSWRDYFKKARHYIAKGYPEYITEFIQFKGVNIGQKGLMIAVPLKKNGAFNGVMVCTMRLNSLTDRFVKDVKSSERGHTFLLDHRLNVMWSPDESFFGKNLHQLGEGYPDFQQTALRFASGKPGTGEYRFRKYDDAEGLFVDAGEEILEAHTPVKMGRDTWSVVVWSPKETVKEAIRAVYFRQLLVVVLCLLVVVGAYVFVLSAASRNRRRLEEELENRTGLLKESHERLFTILNSLGAAVYTADMQTGEILFANKYLRDIYGDIEGRKCYKVFQENQHSPCDFCTNKKLLKQADTSENLNIRSFETTIPGLWRERRERAIRWVDGRMVRIEVAMTTPCLPPQSKPTSLPPADLPAGQGEAPLGTP